MLNNILRNVKYAYKSYNNASKVLIKLYSVFIIGIISGRLLPRLEGLGVYSQYWGYIFIMLTALGIYLNYKRNIFK